MRLTRYLPHVAVATFAVVGLPALIASAVQALLGLGGVLSVVLAMALSILFARAGSALWMRRPASRDIVFGDLMVWGWLRRMRAERRLTRVEQLLGHGELSSVRRTELLKTLASGLEARDSYTHGHSKRVARHAEAIARGMGLSREQVAKIRTAASVHDVGKIRTPRAILSKPGALSDRERSVMERHVAKGAEMVLGLGDAEITAMVRSHHERLDRSGYPEGLRAEDIPLGARIIAVADTFDSMTSARPYRRASSHKHAIDVLAAESGARLDPRAVAAFRSYYSGERSVPWSALLASTPQRIGQWLAGALQGEGALPLAQGLSALGSAALLGGSMIGTAAKAEGDRPAHGPAKVTATASAPRAASEASIPRERAERGRAPAVRRRGAGTGTRSRRHGAERRGTSLRTGADAPSGAGARPGGSPAQAPQPAGPPGSSPAAGGGGRGTLKVTPQSVELDAKVGPGGLGPVSVPGVGVGVKVEPPKLQQPKPQPPRLQPPKLGGPVLP